MSLSDQIIHGTVYLVVDPYPDEGPELRVSGQEALAAGEDAADLAFRPLLIIGDDAGVIHYVDNWYMVSLEKHIAEARLSSLSAAVQCGRQNSEVWPDRIYAHKGDGPINFDLMDLDDRTYLEINSSGVCAYVEEKYGQRPPMTRTEYRQMVDSLADKFDCHVLDVGYYDVGGSLIAEGSIVPDGYFIEGDDDVDEDYDYYADAVHVIIIKLVSNDRDELAGRLLECGRAIHDYLAAIRGGDLDARKIMSVLRGGHANVLLGMHESGHLEIKSSQYNLNAPGQAGERQKIELAQDVARFANGDRDAILVLGYAEEKSKASTKIDRLVPLRLESVDISQYQATLDSKIVPPITGLIIERVQVDREGNAGILFVFVPRQPEEMQPYLVHGAIAGDKVEGAFFSIVQRRGEASITLTASQIHGYIVAGKAFLRRSE